MVEEKNPTEGTTAPTTIPQVPANTTGKALVMEHEMGTALGLSLWVMNTTPLRYPLHFHTQTNRMGAFKKSRPYTKYKQVWKLVCWLSCVCVCYINVFVFPFINIIHGKCKKYQ